MTALEKQLLRLRNFNAWVARSDPQLAEEGADTVNRETLEIAASPESLEKTVQLESIVLRRTRPVLPIKENVTQLVFADPDDSETWKNRLEKASKLLTPAIRAVGRINLTGSELDWVGTGWLVRDNVMVTNRHVAGLFAMRKDAGFIFKMGVGGPMGAAVDFLQEIDNPNTLSFRLVKPIHIEDAEGLDISFFEVEVTGGDPKLAQPLRLAAKPGLTKAAAVIGYPAYDSRIPEPDLMERIYGKIYNKKRLAPGAVTSIEPKRILHNCTTLGGNSGSAVIDLDTGEALGLHFSGTFLSANYAVPSNLVDELLETVRSRRGIRREMRPATQPATAAPPPPLHQPAKAEIGGRSASITIPLTITLSLGVPAPPQRASLPVSPAADGPEVEGEEAVPADYDDRKGYNPNFLGDEARVAPPAITRAADDVLTFDVEGSAESELKYEHYSVVMSRSRRMCFFSAVNIDGNQSKKSARIAWKWDPRIPRAQQIMNECYGNPPKFSRGHMTRREDPGWGDKLTAKRGNEDSMHVTNTTPQMQAFNAPIWLALEDYALQHAREDAMKVSVFTGPYFSSEDPEMYGVRIPLAFWKVIAFIHDDTGRLCATGYQMNQESNLQPEDEFVFGAFTSPQLQIATQIPVRSIEARAGLSFGRLASLDPLAGAEEGLESDLRVPLHALEQIRFF